MDKKLVAIGSGPSGPRFRGAIVDGKYWVAAPDLFNEATNNARLFSRSVPVRPSIAFLASFTGLDRHDIQRAYRDFGFANDSFAGPTCIFLAQQAWPGFFKLSGVPDAEASRLCEALCHEFDRALEECAPKAAEESDSEIAALTRQLKQLQDKLLTTNIKLLQLEQSHKHLSSTVMAELRALSQHVNSRGVRETSREIKEQANRLYARAKQLENEGL